MNRLDQHLSPTRRIVLFFLTVIIVGSLLLNLPLSQLPTSQAEYLDHLFTTVSMVCVTGLSTKPVVDTYNAFGQIICMILMQIGGLGVLSFLGLLYMKAGRKFNFTDRSTLQENLNREEPEEFKLFMFSIFRFTFAFEALGAFLLSFRLVPLFGWSKGIFSSIFLAISAFCNAGFDNLYSNSLQTFKLDATINLVVAGLIIMGGIGFSVWFDFRTQVRNRLIDPAIHKFRLRNLRFHTKVVLYLTVFILAAGTLLSLLTEYNNPDTIGNLPLAQKILVSFFQTVSMRTAGFATLDYTQARPITLLIYIIQMFLGGAPGGTAGGLKITTMLVVLLHARSQILNLPNTNFRHHTVSPAVSQKALTIFVIFTSSFILGLSLLTALEPDVNFMFLAYETISALATVGVSANLTSQLSTASLWVVMGLMFAGRIGPITIITGLNRRKPSKKQTLKYTKSNLIIG